MSYRTNPANSPTRHGHAVAANSLFKDPADLLTRLGHAVAADSLKSNTSKSLISDP